MSGRGQVMLKITITLALTLTYTRTPMFERLQRRVRGVVGSCAEHLTVESYTIRYDTRCYFNVRSKADISQLNLPHGTDN